MNYKLNLMDSFYAESNQLKKWQRVLFYILALLAACFLYTVLLGVANYTFDFTPDEPLYLLICERLLRGDRLIINEWALPQFTALFQILPYFLFKKITGSYEGAVLFMRYVFLATSFLTYLYIIFKYKNRPWLAVTSAFLFCSFVPLCAFLFGYYFLPLAFLFVFASIVVDEDEKHRRFQLVLAGILLSGAVILNPATVFVWLVYCVFVLVRFVSVKRKKPILNDYGFILDLQTFKYLLCGVLISAAVLLTYFQISSGLGNVIRNIPNLMMDSEGDQILSLGYFIVKLKEMLYKYGVFLWLMLCATVADVVFFFLKNRLPKSELIRKLLFLSNFLILILSFFAFYKGVFRGKIMLMMEPPIFLSWFGLHCFLLCRKKNPKMVVFWLIGLSLSLTQDTTSKTSFGFGSAICILPTIVFFIQLINELFIEPKALEEKKKNRKALRHRRKLDGSAVAGSALLACLLAGLLFWSLMNLSFFSYLFRYHPEDQERFTIESGPYKGLSMPEEYITLHDRMTSDLDTVKSLTDEPICIMGGYPFGYPFAYLYLERDINVMSSANNKGFEKNYEKYWQIFPEKRPNIVYIPIEEKVTSIYISRSTFNGMAQEEYVDYGWFEGKAIKGKAGLIVQVSKWNSPEQLKESYVENDLS